MAGMAFLQRLLWPQDMVSPGLRKSKAVPAPSAMSMLPSALGELSAIFTGVGGLALHLFISMTFSEFRNTDG